MDKYLRPALPRATFHIMEDADHFQFLNKCVRVTVDYSIDFDFCDNSVCEMSWRCRKQAPWARQGDLAARGSASPLSACTRSASVKLGRIVTFSACACIAVVILIRTVYFLHNGAVRALKGWRCRKRMRGMPAARLAWVAFVVFVLFAYAIHTIILLLNSTLYYEVCLDSSLRASFALCRPDEFVSIIMPFLDEAISK
jgi:hypothetical protein